MTVPIELPTGERRARRIQAVVALKLLEVMRDRDLPRELLEDEDPSRTIPRRFGLSDVVERQIRTYRVDVRKRTRVSDEEITDLFRLMVRRPDGRHAFEQLGRTLAMPTRPGTWSRLLPLRVRFAMARARTRRKLAKLFGRKIGGFGRGPFVIEGRTLLFITSDPGGGACHLLSGFCKGVLEQTLGGSPEVEHTLCESRGDPLCRWEGRPQRASAQVVPTPLSGSALARGASDG